MDYEGNQWSVKGQQDGNPHENPVRQWTDMFGYRRYKTCRSRFFENWVCERRRWTEGQGNSCSKCCICKTYMLTCKKKKYFFFSHLFVAICFGSFNFGGGWCTWPLTEKSLGFELSHGLVRPNIMVALLVVGLSFSGISNVMLGSIELDVHEGRAWTGFWAGSGVHGSGHSPSPITWPLAVTCGLCGGSDAHRFLLMGFLVFGCIWFSSSKNKKDRNVLIIFSSNKSTPLEESSFKTHLVTWHLAEYSLEIKQ